MACFEDFFLFGFYLFIYLGGGGAERERENPKQAPRHQHRAQRRTRTHEPRGHDLSQNQELDTQPLSHPGALTMAFERLRHL